MPFSVLAILIALNACHSEKINDKNVFYIDNQTDFDRLSGTEFPEGSKVLFASGAEFEGQFVLEGSGSEENPNLLGTYDSKSLEIIDEWSDNKAVINGLGTVESAIYLYNGQHWEINNIEVTNTDGTLNDQGKLKGIYVVAEDAGVMN